MRVLVTELLGIGAVPLDRKSAGKWLERAGVSISQDCRDGRKPQYVNLSDLPEHERLAFLRLELERLELSEGTFDDAAHEAFAAAKPEARARAERKAAIARLWVSLREQGVKEGDRIALVRQQFGSKGTSKASLIRIQGQVEGVAPINFAPALLDGYKATSSRADLSDEAWRFFMTMIRDAAPDWPLKEAWRRVRDAGKPLGWSVPSFPTFYRRWQELDEAQRIEARFGMNEASKRFVQPAHRDKTTLFPMQYVSLDGRTQDFWVRWANGSVSRPVMLMLVDVATNFILGWELVETENATATVRLIKSVCQRFGIFDCLYTDNGSAFAGHLVAGGNGFRFRNGAPKGLQPTGICEIMGIKLQFALPKNAQAKIAERIFATLSRAVDDGPEFKGAHSGHAPGASPSDKTTPVPIEAATAALRRGVESHNREAGRQSQGARGRSYEAMFRDGLERREKPLRTPTARQLYLSGLIWKPVAVDRFGQCQVDGWIYGDLCTQDTLLRHHGKGRRILLGRERCWKVSSLRFLRAQQAPKVITALKAMKSRAA